MLSVGASLCTLAFDAWVYLTKMTCENTETNADMTSLVMFLAMLNEVLL